MSGFEQIERHKDLEHFKEKTNQLITLGDKIESLEEENKTLRELLWLRHGCDISALDYTDDELRCGKCGIDFRQDSVEKIKKTWEFGRQKSLEKRRVRFLRSIGK